MRQAYRSVIFGVFALAILPWACSKEYALAPQAAFTATPTPTSTPCGYPGNTCTPTFTDTATPTGTATSTPISAWPPSPSRTPTVTDTSTVAFTPTATQAALAAPQGAIGWLDPATGYPNIEWVIDQSAAVTGYSVYYSSTGAAGSYALAGSAAKPTGPNMDTMSYYDMQTSFNFYFYVVATGTLPNSPPSRVVHAVSGTTSVNALAISVSNGTAPVFSVTGTVPGAFMRSYKVMQVPPVNYWYWGDEGSPLTGSVNYGYSATGITYVPSYPLPAATNNIPVTVRTYNNQYWSVDVSYRTFNTP